MCGEAVAWGCGGSGGGERMVGRGVGEGMGRRGKGKYSGWVYGKESGHVGEREKGSAVGGYGVRAVGERGRDVG